MIMIELMLAACRRPPPPLCIYAVCLSAELLSKCGGLFHHLRTGHAPWSFCSRTSGGKVRSGQKDECVTDRHFAEITIDCVSVSYARFDICRRTDDWTSIWREEIQNRNRLLNLAGRNSIPFSILLVHPYRSAAAGELKRD
jgi:hypothetical protein